jgi:hypothetical protein
MHEYMGIIVHKGIDGHRGSMRRNTSVTMPSMPKGDIVGKSVFIDVNKEWLSLMSIEVMGLFGEVFKVVPLWHSSKHGPQGRHFEEVYKKP